MELKMPPDKRNSRISQDNYPLRNGRTLFSTVRTDLRGLNLTPDYWIDATNGNDSNDGTSEGAAWATLSKIGDIALGAGVNVVVRVKADTYDEAGDYVLRNDASVGGPVGAGATLTIVYEPSTTTDGTAVNAITPTNGHEFSGSNTWTTIVYGNGLIVQNYSEATASSPNGFGNRDTHILYVYDAECDNCDDGFSAHGSAEMYLFDCIGRNAEKSPLISVDSSYTEATRCEFYPETSTNGTSGGSAAMVLRDCKIIPQSNNLNWDFGNTTAINCQIGSLANSAQAFNTVAGSISDSFVNLYIDGNRVLSLTDCYGKFSARQRNGGDISVSHCVFSGPATGQTAIFLSNFNPGSGGTLSVTDNIFETATAAAFMSYDATNAGYLVAAGAEFFNNVLSGSAAFDADLVSADSGGTVIVDNVTGDALIGAANTLDPDDYGYATGSPAIGAATDGGNSGFAIGDVTPTKPKRTITETL